MKLRVSFRTVLLVTVLVIPLVTVGVVSLLSYRNARAIVDDLSERVLQQTADRIHQEVRTLLDTASVVSRVNQSALGRRSLAYDDLESIVLRFHRLMQVYEEFTYLSIGLETGDYGHARRYPDGMIELRLRRMQDAGRVLRRDHELRAGELVLVDERWDEYDPRVRPFYAAAREAGAQTWPDVYLFSNHPRPDYPGLTCATPVFDAEERLTGVLTADFDLIMLGEFLDGLSIFDTGEAFVVEQGSGGARRVVAHPDPEVIVGEVETGDGKVDDILPIERIESPAIRAFMSQVEQDGGSPDGTDVERVAFSVDGERYVGAYRPLQSGHDLRWLIGIIVPEHELLERVEKSNLENLLIASISLVVLALLGVVVAALVSRPLTRLARQTEAIGRFQLAPTPPDRTNLAEVDRLADAMEEMKAGLRSFGKFVPADLVRSLLASGEEARLGGRRATLTVYFSDIVGFTSIAEKLDPEQLVDLLGEYLEAMSGEIVACGGTVDKYIGDAVMAFWGAPRPSDDHAVDGCRAALRTQRRLAELRAKWRDEGRPLIHMRVGVNTGELVVGNMGSESRLTYTVMGDPVNLASRLEGLNKYTQTEILVSAETFDAARKHVVARPLDRIGVKGKERGTVVYELLAMRDEATGEQRELARRGTEALEAYWSREFQEAVGAFGRVLEIRPGDPSAQRLMEESRAFVSRPPPEGWDAVHRMESK
jgi:adenylate cyclase